jgi:hypothetical protein
MTNTDKAIVVLLLIWCALILFLGAPYGFLGRLGLVISLLGVVSRLKQGAK